MNEWMKVHWLILSVFENRLRAGLVWYTMQITPAVEQNKKKNIVRRRAESEWVRII